MNKEWITPLKWDNEGVEPSDTLKAEGFKAKYKPAADTFNYFLHLFQVCIEELQREFDKRIAVATRGEDTANALNQVICNYTATVEGITELYNGLEIIIIPDTNSNSNVEGQPLNHITLNLNNLGAIWVRRPLSSNTSASETPHQNSYLVANMPCRLMLREKPLNNGEVERLWVMADKQMTSAQDLYGQVPIESGGTGANTRAGALCKLAGMVKGTYDDPMGDAKGMPLIFDSLRDAGIVSSSNTTELVMDSMGEECIMFEHSINHTVHLTDAPCKHGSCILFTNANDGKAGLLFSYDGDIFAYTNQCKWIEIYTVNKADTTPTKDSKNVITSGGVYAALESTKKYLHQYVIHFKNTIEQTGVVGITFVANTDASLASLSGVAGIWAIMKNTYSKRVPASGTVYSASNKTIFAIEATTERLDVYHSEDGDGMYGSFDLLTSTIVDVYCNVVQI